MSDGWGEADVGVAANSSHGATGADLADDPVFTYVRGLVADDTWTSAIGYEEALARVLDLFCELSVGEGFKPSYAKIAKYVSLRMDGVWYSSEADGLYVVRADYGMRGLSGALPGQYTLASEAELREACSPFVVEIARLLNRCRDAEGAAFVLGERYDAKEGRMVPVRTVNKEFVNCQNACYAVQARTVNEIFNKICGSGPSGGLLPLVTFDKLVGGSDQAPCKDKVISVVWDEGPIGVRWGHAVYRVDVDDWAGGKLFGHRILGTLGINWEGEVDMLGLRVLRRLCGEDEISGGPVSEGVCRLIGEGCVCRDGELGMIFRGEGGDGKSTFFSILKAMYGVGGALKGSRGGKLDDPDMLFGQNKNHPSGSLGMVATSALVIDDAADAQVFNLRFSTALVSNGGATIPYRGMHRAFSEGFGVRVYGTPFIQMNSWANLAHASSLQALDRRYVGIDCRNLLSDFHDGMEFVGRVREAIKDPESLDEIARGLLHYCLPLVAHDAYFFPPDGRLDDALYVHWQQALRIAAEGGSDGGSVLGSVDDFAAMRLGICDCADGKAAREGGPSSCPHVVCCNVMVDLAVEGWTYAGSEIEATKQLRRRLVPLALRSTKATSVPLKTLAGGRSRVYFVRGVYTDIERAVLDAGMMATIVAKDKS